MTFTLDTSGYVLIGPHVPPTRPGSGGTLRVVWSDLTPFQQGYVEALFASCTFTDHTGRVQPHMLAHVSPGMKRWRKVGFSDLSPEALARIMGDCEARYTELVPAMRRQRRNGREFHEQRQQGVWPERFPPQTPYLNDEGKVCLRERDQ